MILTVYRAAIAAAVIVIGTYGCTTLPKTHN